MNRNWRVHAGRCREDRRACRRPSRCGEHRDSGSPRPRYRGRFAPSPTGPLHFGSLVAALASYCDARAAGGQWLLRIEDVDRPRSRPGAEAAILATLERYGFAWDGEVSRQSERADAMPPRSSACAPNGHASTNARARGASSRRAADRAGRRARLSGNLPQRNAGRSARPSGARLARARRQTRASNSTTACRDRRRRTSRAMSATSWCGAPTGSTPTSSRSSSTTRSQGITHVVRGADLLASTPRQILLQRTARLRAAVLSARAGRDQRRRRKAVQADRRRGAAGRSAARARRGVALPRPTPAATGRRSGLRRRFLVMGHRRVGSGAAAAGGDAAGAAAFDGAGARERYNWRFSRGAMPLATAAPLTRESP